ncbi:MAG: TolC family protein [Rhodothermales bacterium]
MKRSKKTVNMHPHVLMGALFVSVLLTSMQPAQAQQRPLDDYLSEGLQNNLALKQQAFDLAKSVSAMEEAKGLFFPEVSVEARYSRAGGGRQISFPVGDLLNPVYSTLNDMLAQQGDLPIFPQLENQDIAFLREREQESKVRIIQPLFKPAILHNYRLQQHLATSEEAALEAYKQLLKRDIKIAYYTYLKASRATRIFDAARELVDENLRVNERLVKYEKVTQDAVYRAKAEMLSVSQQQREAKKNADLARSYFNFLLNRSFEEPIDDTDERILMAFIEQPARLIPASAQTLSPSSQKAFEQLALNNRYELKQLEAAIQASQSAVSISKSSLLPGVALAVDLGIQGSDYGFNGDRSFYMASVVFSWKLFNGFQNKMKVQQARIDNQKLHIQHEELQRQIQLQVQEAFDNLEVARESYETAAQRLEASSEGYRLVSRRYDEGMANQVVFLDARTTFTEAEMNLNITRYEVLIRMAELEFATAVNSLQ